MTNMLSIHNLFLISLLFNVSYAAKMLMMAINVGYSHLEFTGKLADILVDAGHNVDYFYQVYDRQMKHNGTKKANIIRFEGKNVEQVEKGLYDSGAWMDSFNHDWSKEKQIGIFNAFALNCEDLLTDYKTIDYLRSQNYTIGLAEVFDSCSFSLFRLLGIKSTHELNAVPLTEASNYVHGIDYDFRHVPLFYNYKQIGPVTTFMERLYNLYIYLDTRFSAASFVYSPANKIFKKLFGQDHPTLGELQQKSSYIWVNTHEMADFSHGNAPKVKRIGGITMTKPQQLNEETAKIFEKAEKGVVLVSFGSIVNTTDMKPELRDSMLQAFARFPDYKFIWRLTKVDENITAIINQYPNVYAFKWLQQSSILAHPKTVGFISHMGLNSFNEAVHHGVPMLCVPFFWDQYLNAANAIKRGVGVFLNRKDITVDSMANGLSQILHNKKYLENALNLKAMIDHSPINQTEMFIKHVEFAEKFGSLDNLELDSAGASLIEEFNLDLIAFAIFVLFVVSYLALFLLRRIIGVIKIVDNQLTKATRTKKIE